MHTCASYGIIPTSVSTEDNKLLNKLCDDLVSFKITADDILEQEEAIVSSSDNTPVKEPDMKKHNKKSSASSNRILNLAKQLSTSHKDIEVIADIDAKATSSKDATPARLTPYGSKAATGTSSKIAVASKRAQQMFGTATKDNFNVESDDSLDSSDRVTAVTQSYSVTWS